MSLDGFPGGHLERQRHKMGLSVDDVYRKLRIPPAYVSAFESGEVDGLPVETYAVGFLKTYCEFLQLDAEPWLDALREHQASAKMESGAGAGSTLSSKPKWMRDTVAWVAVCAILALGWLAYSVVLQPGTPDREGQVQADTLDVEVSDIQLPELVIPRR